MLHGIRQTDGRTEGRRDLKGTALERQHACKLGVRVQHSELFPCADINSLIIKCLSLTSFYYRPFPKKIPENVEALM